MSTPDREVVVVSAVRTAIGTYGGALAGTPPADLAALCVRESVARAGLEPGTVEHCVVGNVIHTEPRDMYMARVAAVNGGLPVETPALTVNRLCGSGLQAVVSAAQLIQQGDAATVVAGGAECMSRAQYWLPGLRFGQRLGDGQVIDAMVGALSDPFDSCHMGITAENVAERWGISREDQDALALESQERAARAIDEGRFKDQIVPVEVKVKREKIAFDTDEHVRRGTTLEGLAKLRPAFKGDGSVTAGNASGLNDGAAAVVLMERGAAEAKGLKPMARLVGYGFAGVEPKYMGIGPVPATRALLDRIGLEVSDIDVFEVNEAFAAQALAVCRDLDLPADKVNPNGSGISLGHPIGATGCVITVKALYELERVGGRYALVTMCIGGGQGIAAVFERLG
ncbi:acetyl-CoA C-acyltransferase family protein [Thioalkalivibrio sp. XN8]|uniref:acetyl-CoA C-acyltransferase family protein n=1 Tax=Thioalkalivibrio sp. XN8 TaxID=2712863 RepID=UPI0013EA1FC8|nr:acetyl-CoA C-acyltransferase family protein [Thioalkalivibrio sp. XN8]NGP52637.1 acetyl-CoA C-acyltransferase family protein [Thioalkalivibrio sp. XN8]